MADNPFFCIFYSLFWIGAASTSEWNWIYELRIPAIPLFFLLSPIYFIRPGERKDVTKRKYIKMKKKKNVDIFLSAEQTHIFIQIT